MEGRRAGSIQIGVCYWGDCSAQNCVSALYSVEQVADPRGGGDMTGTQGAAEGCWVKRLSCSLGPKLMITTVQHTDPIQRGTVLRIAPAGSRWRDRRRLAPG